MNFEWNIADAGEANNMMRQNQLVAQSQALKRLDLLSQQQHQRRLSPSNALFPQKLYDMLDDCEKFGNGWIISWLPNGKSFKVHDIDAFVSQLMPYYFRQTKYRSFQRQLNFWGFQRDCVRGGEKGAYSHPHFLRGCPSLCQYLSRNYNPTMPGSQDMEKKTEQNKKSDESSQSDASAEGTHSTESRQYGAAITTPSNCDISTTLADKKNNMTKKANATNITLTGDTDSGTLNGFLDPLDDNFFLDEMMRANTCDLVSLPAYQLCDVFSSDEDSPVVETKKLSTDDFAALLSRTDDAIQSLGQLLEEGNRFPSIAQQEDRDIDTLSVDTNFWDEDYGFFP